jgi:putative restriction endonuclease
MREVAPGDVIFSFRDTRIAALGIARSYCYESPKPTEFCSIGSNWGPTGWKVEVAFRELANRVRSKDHIAELRALLPDKYSPLRPTGDGLHSVYLAEVSAALATALFRLVGHEANQVADAGCAVGQPGSSHGDPRADAGGMGTEKYLAVHKSASPLKLPHEYSLTKGVGVILARVE